MSIDAVTVKLLSSVLSSPGTLKLFNTIASRRIAEATSLKQESDGADQALNALSDADLIGSAKNGNKYFVTAKGLKVARDLEKLPAR